MTPKGFRAWLKQSGTGDTIIYHQGSNLDETKASRKIRDAVWAAYEQGLVTLTQSRLSPKQGLRKGTVGQFAYIATKLEIEE